MITNKFPVIYLYRGATSEINFDFTNFDFSNGGYCQFAMKKILNDEIIKTINFIESDKYTIVFQDDFTVNLTDNEYRYDIMYMINDERYPQCVPSKIIVKEVVNKYAENSSE